MTGTRKGGRINGDANVWRQNIFFIFFIYLICKTEMKIKEIEMVGHAAVGVAVSERT